MHRLFLPPDQLAGDIARIIGPDHLHLARVLRARPGEPILLLDDRGNAFHARLVTVERAETTARIIERVPAPPEPDVEITIAQALGKGDKFEQVIQHGTEVGACVFVPVRSERCIADLPTARAADRLARWRQIVRGAAEQSGRGRIPRIEAPVRFTDLLCRPDSYHACLMLHPSSPDALPLRVALRQLNTPCRLLLAVGPEGGWSEVEVSQAQAANMQVVTLGPRILRTETAALVAISQILYQWSVVSGQ